jgi:hypothetical protein
LKDRAKIRKVYIEQSITLLLGSEQKMNVKTGIGIIAGVAVVAAYIAWFVSTHLSLIL